MEVEDLRELIRQGMVILDTPHFVERLQKREVTEDLAIQVALEGRVVERQIDDSYLFEKTVSPDGRRYERLHVAVMPVKVRRGKYRALFKTAIWPDRSTRRSVR